MRTERNPIKVMVILNQSESYEDFEQFLMAHGISSFSRGEFPYDYYAIEAPAKIIKKIPSSFDYVIGVKENVKSELCMSESLATVGVFPSLHQNFDLKGDSDMSVAVIDWGFDPTHPSLASGLYYWKDFTANASPIATDPFGHGTAVSSLIMGRPFNTTDSQGRQVVCGDQSYHYSKADLIENVKYISTVTDTISAPRARFYLTHLGKKMMHNQRFIYQNFALFMKTGHILQLPRTTLKKIPTIHFHIH